MGGVYISNAVRTAIGKNLPLDYEYVAEQRVKNIQDSIRACQVRVRPVAEPRKTLTRMPEIAPRGTIACQLAGMTRSVMNYLTPDFRRVTATHTDTARDLLVPAQTWVGKRRTAEKFSSKRATTGQGLVATRSNNINNGCSITLSMREKGCCSLYTF